LSATNEEVAMTLPGDKLLAKPLVDWTTATTINARPDQVWSWIAQIGDTRGGFYSYTFIENQIGSLMGSGDYKVVYHNADRIVPEWQDPRPGEQIIQGVLKITEARPNEYLLADSSPRIDGLDVGVVAQPINGGAQTRLISRSRVQPPPGLRTPSCSSCSASGFRDDAEHDAAFSSARRVGEPRISKQLRSFCGWRRFVAGLAAAGLFVVKRNWRAAALVTVASAIVVLVLTIDAAGHLGAGGDGCAVVVWRRLVILDTRHVVFEAGSALHGQ
jgi:hypothetical protein